MPDKSFSLVGTPSEFSSISTPSIRAMTVGGNYLWLGSDIGLYLYDKALDELVWYTSELPDIRDLSLYKYKLWVITEERTASYERGAAFNSWTYFSDNRVVEKSVSDQGIPGEKEEDHERGVGLTRLTSGVVIDNLLWVGREKGLKVYNIREKRPIDVEFPEDIKEKKVTAMASDDQYLWVGTRDGLYRRDIKTEAWEFFNENQGLASKYVSCLAVDEEHVWVGSSDKGISRYDRTTGQWQIFSRNDGLSDNNVRGIAVDGKYIWFGTFSGGVCRYDKTTDLWTTYRAEDYTGRPQI